MATKPDDKSGLQPMRRLVTAVVGILSVLSVRPKVAELAFHVFSQERYVEAVRLCVARQTRELNEEVPWTKELEIEAIQWSRDKSKRCGRTAYQFAKYYIGRYLLDKHDTLDKVEKDALAPICETIAEMVISPA